MALHLLWTRAGMKRIQQTTGSHRFPCTDEVNEEKQFVRPQFPWRGQNQFQPDLHLMFPLDS